MSIQHRKVYQVDVGNMKPKDVKRYIDNFVTKHKYSVSDDEVAIDLRKYTSTTQILIKNKWELDEKSWMGKESKSFFRLWRFVYRDIQRRDGFDDDITEYDEFVKEWEVLRIEGDYVIVKNRKPKPKSKVKWPSYSETKRMKDVSVTSNYYLPDRSPYQHSLETSRRRAVDRFGGRIEHSIRHEHHTSNILDRYRGVSITDSDAIQGMYNVLMSYEPMMTRDTFYKYWELLSMINGTSVAPEWYWGSQYGKIESTLDIHSIDPQSTEPVKWSTSTLGDLDPISCDVEQLTSQLLDDRNWVKYNYTKSLVRNMDFTLDHLYGKSRSDYSIMDEFLFRSVIYYPSRGKDSTRMMELPKDLGGDRTHINEETDMYVRKSQSEMMKLSVHT